jgi:hypothetical protein
MTDIAELERELARQRLRNVKAAEAVDIILYVHNELDLPDPHPDAIDGLDEDGWAALEQLLTRARHKTHTVELRSPETRQAVPREYRRRIEHRQRLAAMTDEELFNV